MENPNDASLKVGDEEVDVSDGILSVKRCFVRIDSLYNDVLKYLNQLQPSGNNYDLLIPKMSLSETNLIKIKMS